MTNIMIMIQTLGQCDQMDSHGTDDAAEEPKRRLLRQNGLYTTSNGTWRDCIVNYLWLL